MKRTITILLLAVLAMFCQITTASADTSTPAVQTLPDGSTVYLFSDGSKLTVSAVRSVAEEKGVMTNTSGSKDMTFTNSDNVVEWKYTLHATFSYTYGVSSSCTSAYYTQNIYQGNWSFSNGSATKSGNTAHGVGTFEKRVLFIVINTVDVDLHIYCDKYGVVS